MNRETFDALRRLVYEQSGIFLSPGKEALVSARIGKRMRTLGIETYEGYLRHLRSGDDEDELIHMLDAISTNVTRFFREEEHFEFLRDIFRGWLAGGQTRFRFWSAACSTGEEPYSMAMTLLDVLGGGKADTRILATDISTSVLRKCLAGTYDEERTQSMPPGFRERYFDRVNGSDPPAYSASESLRRMILFRRLNLSTPPFPMRGPLDAVFCRNVMIYFDNTVRMRLLNEIHRLLKPGGYLFVGHAESLTGMVSRFRVLKPSIYVK